MPAKAQDDDLVQSWVDLALCRPPDERETYLRSACAGDPELFSQAWHYVEWEQRMNGFLLEPLVATAVKEHPFDQGELLDGRFRIVREVAQGGMGVVYEAVDEKLDRRIALKCAKAGFDKRLPPEVRNAREISHPNVCKSFEIHTCSTDHGDIDFLTMEFLEGETLADRLSRRPMPAHEARAIAKQLCAGLAEAHRNQVIHGDLKSNNVILTTGADGSPRAVITDFGLAHSRETAQGGAQSGAAGGTPDYMAPELWKGGKVSVASDIYALGVILYELVSGRRPHGNEGSQAALSWEQRLTRKPPAVHPKWDRILAHCLDPDPARRFRGADEVARALEPPRSRRRFLGLAVAALLAFVFAGVMYQRAKAPQESVRLAVLPFESDRESAGSADRLFRDTGGELARLKGGSRARLTIISPSKTLSKHVDTTEKARAALGATHVLHGTLGKQKDRLLLHAYLTDARSLVNAKEWKAEYTPGDLRYAPVALAGMVTGTLRLPPLAVAAVVNAAARQDYLAGLGHVERYSADAALALLERAVNADPDSPLTHAGLAEARWLKYALSKDKKWLDRTTDSVRLAQERNPDLAQVHNIAGLLQANSGFYEQAAAEYRRAIELEPNNGDAYRRLGIAYQSNNQLDDALMAFQKATEVQPSSFKPFQSLGAFYSRRGDYADAAKAFQKMVALAPDLSDSHFVLAIAYQELGRFADAEKELRISIGLQDTSQAEHNLGYIIMQQGRDQEAIPFYRRALAIGPETALHWLNLGVSQARAGYASDARAAFRRGLELAEKEMVKDPRKGVARAELAYLCARLGDSRRAESEAAQAVQLSPNDKDARWMAVATYERLGRREWALALIGSSPLGMLPGLLSELNAYPDLADLQKDSRFLQMMAPYHGQ
jgi:tetratricopeptide (TPR) repeat protein/TolB-like protein